MVDAEAKAISDFDAISGAARWNFLASHSLLAFGRPREALLHRIQQLTIDRVMFTPIWNARVLMGVAPRVTDHTINLVPMSIFPSYEDMRLKGQ